MCDNTWDPTGMRHGTVILPGYAERGDAGGPCKEPYSVGQVVVYIVLSFLFENFHNSVLLVGWQRQIEDAMRQRHLSACGGRWEQKPGSNARWTGETGWNDERRFEQTQGPVKHASHGSCHRGPLEVRHQQSWKRWSFAGNEYPESWQKKNGSYLETWITAPDFINHVSFPGPYCMCALSIYHHFTGFQGCWTAHPDPERKRGCPGRLTVQPPEDECPDECCGSPFRVRKSWIQRRNNPIRGRLRALD